MSEGFAATIGPKVDPEHLVGKSDRDLYTEEHARSALDDEQRVLRTGVPMVDVIERETWSDRPDSWVCTTKAPLRDGTGQIIGTFGISRDITAEIEAAQLIERDADELARSNEELRQLESELRIVLECSPDAIARYDRDLRYLYINPSAEATLGRSRDEVIGRADADLDWPEELLAKWVSGLRRVLATGTGCEVEFATDVAGLKRWVQARMVPEIDADGAVIGVLTWTRDLTEVKRAEQALAHQALHDPVTGLANRVLLLDRLTQALLALERNPGRIALFFVDLDNFKVVNDSYGHGAGDRLLIEIGRRLSLSGRRIDTVARFGGDEFVVLCSRLREDDDVRMMAGRMMRALAQPFRDEGRDLSVTASVGIVVAGDHRGPGRAVRDADAAMYQAKERGRNRLQLFDPVLRDRALAKHTLESDLRRAIERSEFFLLYQPLFSLSNQSIRGVEALIRWRHPARGVLLPAEFISVAEERGLICEIGAWVVGEACRQLAEWNGVGDPDRPLTMAVNISGRQLADADLVHVVANAIARNGIQPAQLCLEVTETALIEEIGDAQGTLAALSHLGVRLALDDFGTGYSSLAHIHSFRVDTLKIDRSFVEHLGRSERDREIVGAVTTMAHVLGMTVVGEGIETDDQLSELAGLSCDDGQGFLLARPLPPDGVTSLLGSS